MENTTSFSVCHTHQLVKPYSIAGKRNVSPLFSNDPSEEEIEALVENSKMSTEDVAKVANLAADDEWMGLSMELSELVRVAVIEETKKNTREFIGKDDYKVRD